MKPKIQVSRDTLTNKINSDTASNVEQSVRDVSFLLYTKAKHTRIVQSVMQASLGVLLQPILTTSPLMCHGSFVLGNLVIQ